MGGEWFPTAFLPARAEVWGYALRIVRDDDWYRCVGLRLENSTTLLVREGYEERLVKVDDSTLELFQAVKSAGALVVDRFNRKCWTSANWVLVLDYLDYTNEIADQDCDPQPDKVVKRIQSPHA
jgi:hypothetical protein